jgi:hypothetical protein
LEAERATRSAEIQAILETERNAVEEWFNVLWAGREAEWESRLSRDTSTATASQDTLALVIDDAPRHLVRSSAGSTVGIISYCLLTLFVIICRCCGSRPWGAGHTDQMKTTDIDSRDRSVPLE